MISMPSSSVNSSGLTVVNTLGQNTGTQPATIATRVDEAAALSLGLKLEQTDPKFTFIFSQYSTIYERYVNAPTAFYKLEYIRIIIVKMYELNLFQPYSLGSSSHQVAASQAPDQLARPTEGKIISASNVAFYVHFDPQAKDPLCILALNNSVFHKFNGTPDVVEYSSSHITYKVMNVVKNKYDHLKVGVLEVGENRVIHEFTNLQKKEAVIPSFFPQYPFPRALIHFDSPRFYVMHPKVTASIYSANAQIRLDKLLLDTQGKNYQRYNFQDRVLFCQSLIKSLQKISDNGFYFSELTPRVIEVIDPLNFRDPVINMGDAKKTLLFIDQTIAKVITNRVATAEFPRWTNLVESDTYTCTHITASLSERFKKIKTDMLLIMAQHPIYAPDGQKLRTIACAEKIKEPLFKAKNTFGMISLANILCEVLTGGVSLLPRNSEGILYDIYSYNPAVLIAQMIRRNPKIQPDVRHDLAFEIIGQMIADDSVNAVTYAEVEDKWNKLAESLKTPKSADVMPAIQQQSSSSALTVSEKNKFLASRLGTLVTEDQLDDKGSFNTGDFVALQESENTFMIVQLGHPHSERFSYWDGSAKNEQLEDRAFFHSINVSKMMGNNESASSTDLA